jgi:thiamine-phosphate diphosphorylase
VFGTSTKKDAKPLDPAYFQQICESVSIPVVAIGGINADNMSELYGTGIAGIIVISAIFANDDIRAATKVLAEKAETF